MPIYLTHKKVFARDWSYNYRVINYELIYQSILLTISCIDTCKKFDRRYLKLFLLSWIITSFITIISRMIINNHLCNYKFIFLGFNSFILIILNMCAKRVIRTNPKTLLMKNVRYPKTTIFIGTNLKNSRHALDNGHPN